MSCSFDCRQGRTCNCTQVGELTEPDLWELILVWICIALASATSVGICAFFAGVLINHLSN